MALVSASVALFVLTGIIISTFSRISGSDISSLAGYAIAAQRFHLNFPLPTL